MRWLPLLIPILAAGCVPKPDRVISDPDPIIAIPAMKTAAEQKNESALKDLVHKLSSSDAAQRMYAIDALDHLTGQTLGYVYYDDDDRRAAAVERWKAWLASRGSAP